MRVDDIVVGEEYEFDSVDRAHVVVLFIGRDRRGRRTLDVKALDSGTFHKAGEIRRGQSPLKVTRPWSERAAEDKLVDELTALCDRLNAIMQRRHGDVFGRWAVPPDRYMLRARDSVAFCSLGLRAMTALVAEIEK